MMGELTSSSSITCNTHFVILLLMKMIKMH